MPIVHCGMTTVRARLCDVEFGAEGSRADTLCRMLLSHLVHRGPDTRNQKPAPCHALRNKSRTCAMPIAHCGQITVRARLGDIESGAAGPTTASSSVLRGVAAVVLVNALRPGLHVADHLADHGLWDCHGCAAEPGLEGGIAFVRGGASPHPSASQPRPTKRSHMCWCLANMSGTRLVRCPSRPLP